MNHVIGFQLYASESPNSDTLGNRVDITVFHEKELSSGFSNKAYNGISMHSINRVMAGIKYLIVTCPDSRMVGMYDESGHSEYITTAYLSEEKAQAERDRLNANLKARKDYREDYSTITVEVADAEDRP